MKDKLPPLRETIADALDNLQTLRTDLRAHGELAALREELATLKSEKEAAEQELAEIREQIATDTALAHQARTERELAETQRLEEKRRYATLKAQFEALEASRRTLGSI